MRSYLKWWSALLFLFVIAGVITTVLLLWWRNSSLDVLTFTDPEYILRWRGGVESKSGSDAVVFVLSCPFERAGITPECSFSIIDRSSWFHENRNHVSFYLPLEWKNRRLALEPGTIEPKVSYTLSGFLELKEKMTELAPNVFELQMTVLYAKSKGSEVKISKTISITVQIEDGLAK